MSIRLRYILALSLIALIVSASALSMSYIFSAQENDASIINRAGQQRMLSQKIALLVQRLSDCGGSTQYELDAMRSSVNRFEENHKFLTTLQDLDPQIKALYWGEDVLDQKVKTYIEQARTYAQDIQCSVIPDYFDTQHTELMLFSLDQIVQNFETLAHQRVVHVERLELFLWLITLGILCLEVIFIFRPMELKILSTFKSLDIAINQAKKSKEQAVAANKAKSEFLASMSHELRTPMNGLFGMIDLAIDNPSKSDNYLKKAKNAGRQLLMLINDVLDLSKIEAGKLRIERVSFNLYQVIDDAVSLQAIYCRKKGLEFDYVKETSLPDKIIGDPSRITQVLHNLLSNAIKFTNQGKVILRISCKVVKQKHCLNIEVEDTGVGIDENKQKTIFNMFEQADQTTTRLYGGTGLGLSISAKLTQLMGGTLQVESVVAKGSIFTLSLPITIDTQAPSIQQSALMLSCAIVDDLQTSREYLEHVTQHKGLSTTCYSTAQEFLQDNPEKFDVLILDLSMPLIDGVDTIEALLAQNLSKLPYVFLISAVLEHLDCSEAVRNAIWRTHSKPIDRRAFESDLTEVQNIIQQSTLSTNQNTHKGVHILVVEDNEINAEVVKSMLENKQYDVTIAYDGEKAVEACTIEDYDLILMDLQMPKMDGITATRILRKKLNLKTPIVALTANAFTEDKKQCMQAGMNDFLAKPIDKIKLLATVEHLIAKNPKKTKD